jgi:hypothetical protein
VPPPSGFVLVREVVEPRWAPFRLGIAAPYWDWVFRTKVDRARRAAPAPRED